MTFDGSFALFIALKMKNKKFSTIKLARVIAGKRRRLRSSRISIKHAANCRSFQSHFPRHLKLHSALSAAFAALFLHENCNWVNTKRIEGSKLEKSAHCLSIFPLFFGFVERRGKCGAITVSRRARRKEKLEVKIWEIQFN
jgi:hypothetical protein